MAKKRSPSSPHPVANAARPQLPPLHVPPPPGARPRIRLGPVLVGGTLLYLGATAVTYYVASEKKKASALAAAEAVGRGGDAGNSIDPNTFDTQPVWDRIASTYDRDVGTDEFWIGLGLIRRWLLRHAKGDVLEVSAGTGRNLPYYVPKQITSLTLTDRSASMLSETQSKFSEYSQKFHSVFVSFQPAEAERLDTLSPPPVTTTTATTPSYPVKYDTVVDTFGLCSCRDPVAVLVSLARACRSSDGSRILLLEHGRSRWKWLNRLLDAQAVKHAEKWGCWWNRDMVGLLEKEEVKEELEVLYLSRWHFGTTCYVVARPRRKEDQEGGGAEQENRV